MKQNLCFSLSYAPADVANVLINEPQHGFVVSRVFRHWELN